MADFQEFVAHPFLLLFCPIAGQVSSADVLYCRQANISRNQASNIAGGASKKLTKYLKIQDTHHIVRIRHQTRRQLLYYISNEDSLCTDLMKSSSWQRFLLTRFVSDFPDVEQSDLKDTLISSRCTVDHLWSPCACKILLDTCASFHGVFPSCQLRKLFFSLRVEYEQGLIQVEQTVLKDAQLLMITLAETAWHARRCIYL